MHSYKKSLHFVKENVNLLRVKIKQELRNSITYATESVLKCFAKVCKEMNRNGTTHEC